MTLPQSRPTALVVDDDALFRAATVAALARLDFRIREADSGEAARSGTWGAWMVMSVVLSGAHVGDVR